MDAAMNSAVSALQAQSSALSTVSNNLANSQTTGYKAVDTQFLSLLSQESQGISFPSGGVTAVARQNLMDQGLIQGTSTTTDMAINGNGLFPVQYGLDGSQTFYTRNGAFDADSKGNLLLSGTNYYLMGWETDATGKVLGANPDNTASLQPVNISKYNSSAVATTSYTLQANLPAEAQNSLAGFSYINTATGASENMTVSYVQTGTTGSGTAATTTYLMAVDAPPGETVKDGSATASQLMYSVTVDANGNFTSVTGQNGDTYSSTGTPATLPSFTPSTAGTAVTLPSLTSWTTLQASLKNNFSQPTSMAVYDSLGVQQTFPVTWTAAGNNSWLMTVSTPTNPAGTATTGELVNGATTPAVVSSYTYEVSFNSNGSLNTIKALNNAPMSSSGEPELQANWLDGAATPGVVAVDLGTQGQTNGLSQFDTGETTPLIAVKSTSQNGVQYGQLTGVSVDSSGNVIAAYDNGQKVPIWKIPVVTFPNENGLQAMNDGVYAQSSQSGNYMLNQAGTNGAGSVQGSSLESSNVNTSVEFSNMITAQQAYSSASQVIKTDQQNFQTLIQSIQ